MNHFEILIVGTNGREVSFCVTAYHFLDAWDVLHDITSEIAYIGAPYSVTIKEL